MRDDEVAVVEDVVADEPVEEPDDLVAGGLLPLVRHSLELGQAEAIRAGVLGGLGYAVISRTVVADDLAAGRIVALPLRPARREFTAVRRPAALAPALIAFWRHLDEVRVNR